MGLEKYFNDKGGIFTALAVFITFMVISEEYLFLSFSGFFISFTLICYLLDENSRIRHSDIWNCILYLGYNLLFIASLLYGIKKYYILNDGPFFYLVLIMIICFYGVITLRGFYNHIINF